MLTNTLAILESEVIMAPKNMTKQELFKLRELLEKWSKEYNENAEFFKTRITERDGDEEHEDFLFRWYATCIEERRKVQHVIREVEFTLEDMTGEVLVP